MKTKNKGILLTIFLFLFSLLIIFIPAQAAQQTAVTIKSKTYYADNKEFMRVKGLDSNKKVVWKYVTKNIRPQNSAAPNVSAGKIRFMFSKTQK